MTVRIGDVAKRLLDIAVATVACIVLLPVLVGLAVAVRLDGPGPALFRQTRVGQHGRTFTMFKLRTMRAGADEEVHRAYVVQLLGAQHASASEHASAPEPRHELFKLDGDDRVTRVGGFIRRTSLDELPQLFNVIRGDMSLVGPRPALVYEAELMRVSHPRRFDVRPGITGLWQVSGRNRLSMWQALDLDVAYVESWSLSRDVGILCRTLPAVLRRECR